MQGFVALALATSGVAAVLDARNGQIPNWLSMGSLATACLAHLVAGASSVGLGEGLSEAGWSILGVLACGVVPLLLWRQGAFGGGDVKMLGALGAMLLPSRGIEAEFLALLVAAIVAPARLAWEGRLLRVLANAVSLAANPLLPPSRRRAVAPEMLTSVRFGPALFAGVALFALTHRSG
jgi:prepilin peptidase CpaA